MSASMSVLGRPSEISQLISQAEQALASGDRARADALLRRVKAVDPEHPAILNEAALHELRSGNVTAARELLERAVARDGSNTRLLMNLAGALRRLGLAAEEMRIIERVLAVEPRHLFGLLQKARCWNRKESSAPPPRCITTRCRRFRPARAFRWRCAG